MMPLPVTQNEIAEYYDACRVDYELVWHLKSKMCMHYGYWDETTPNLRSALTNMNQRIAELAGIRQGAYVLDAGCGVGGPSIFLAKNLGCKTLGITLSARQVDISTGNAWRHGVGEQCTFERRDYLNTGLPDETFDVVWAIESVCHAGEKADFLREAFRVLKKGGKLVVADFFRQAEDTSVDKDRLMEQWSAAWAVPEFEFYGSFEHKALQAGFATVETRNITQNILPSAKRLYYCFIPGIICDGALRAIGMRSKTQRANVWSTYFQYKSLKKGLWNYYVMVAAKL